MTAGVLVVGFDAAEAPLLEQWSDEGLLPNLARVRRAGITVDLDNCLDTLPGAIWPELTTGVSGGRTGLYFHARRIHTGEAVPRAIDAAEAFGEARFWTVASRHGKRVCVLDVPQAPPGSDVNGIQVFEWGLHDRSFAVQSTPADVLADIRRRSGDHPVDSCDRFHDGTERGYLALLEALERGADAKTEWAAELIASREWDLGVCCWSESHCVGHQFHHLVHAAEDERGSLDPRLRDSWRRVYQRLDAGLGRLIDAAGPGATVLAVASHGMGPYIAGYQLLPPFLERLGMGPARSVAAAAPGRLPAPLRTMLRSVVPESLRHRRLVAAGQVRSWYWLESPTCRAAPVENNRVGGIRLNLVGREPHGCVEPGADADALIAELERELRAVRQPGTDAPIVRDVLTPVELFGPDHHRDLPDVLVVFRRDLGPLDACWSERVGLIEAPIGSPTLPRTGDHTNESRLWAMGPCIGPASEPTRGNVLDVAPSVLSLLDVPIPTDLDGIPLVVVGGPISRGGG